MKLVCALVLGMAVFGAGCGSKRVGEVKGSELSEEVQFYAVTGVVKEVRWEARQVLVEHGEVAGFMPAMTMPFNVRDTNQLARLAPGDAIEFQLVVGEEESWIDSIEETGRVPVGGPLTTSEESAVPVTAPAPGRPPSSGDLFVFTNEFGQAVNLAEFKGQALGLTFFFTRCPVPDYCPRLSKNFADASALLKEDASMSGDWRFLSITIDPEFDTPEVLRRYGELYNYDPARWTFLTGSKENIANLARTFGFQFEPEGGLFNHGFRTVIIDRSNKVQKVFPFTGSLGQEIAAEMKRAAQAGLEKEAPESAAKAAPAR